MDATQIKVEWIKRHRDVCYFTETYVQIFNAHNKAGAGSGAASGAWIPFKLWPAQRQVLRDLVVHPYTIVLKARQLGMSWLTLRYALWLMLFHPAANIMLMSKRDDESIELLSNRLIEMHILSSCRGTPGRAARKPGTTRSRSICASSPGAPTTASGRSIRRRPNRPSPR